MYGKKTYHVELQVVKTFDSRRPEVKPKHTQVFKLVTTYHLFGLVPIYRTKKRCHATIPQNFPNVHNICVRVAGQPLVTQLSKVTVKDQDICYVDSAGLFK